MKSKRKHEISETNKLLKDKFTNEQNLSYFTT